MLLRLWAAALLVLLAAAASAAPQPRRQAREQPAAWAGGEGQPSSADTGGGGVAGGGSSGAGGATAQVVGGAEAPIGRFPYQLAIRAQTAGGVAYDCGGVLVREDAALTAAHCLYYGAGALGGEREAVSVTVFAGAQGSPFLAGAADAGTPLGPLASWAAHPLFNRDSYYKKYDLAVIFFGQCLDLVPRVRPVRIATPAELSGALGSRWLAAGWGSTSAGAGKDGSGGAMAATLQYAELKYVSTPTCARMVGPVDKTSMLCAAGLPAANGFASPPLQDTCAGDSGGPLVFNLANGTHPLSGPPEADRLAGLTSWGVACGQRGTAGAYTNAAALGAWVAQQLAATPKPCGPQPANATCVSAGPPAARPAGWYACPDETVMVDASAAYAVCCAACAARAAANGSCKAFAVSLSRPARPRPGARARADLVCANTLPEAPRAPQVEASGCVGGNCASCDLFSGAVPHRTCIGAETWPGLSLSCSGYQLGAGRIAFAP